VKQLLPRTLPVVVILSILLASCSPLVVVPVPVIVSTPTVILAASPTSTVTPSDDVWDRIVANQKIVVGTSWDYPPFSSVDPNYQVVGFDIAMVKEIGRRLNIPVEIQNYAFDGLLDALQLNQIDIAVAAIAITPERASQFSFSPIYYVNQTAILARNDGLITSITNFDQLAGFRVGVRRGTTYEKMVQNLLVDTGLMSADKLLSYTQTNESVRDLIANRVDAIVLGEATANYYGSQQGLSVVGKGFHEQDLAVAMRSGTPRLKAEIDRVMDGMLTDGTILSLIQEYIQSDVTGVLSTPIPPIPTTVTPVVPLPTAVPPVCVDGMKFVADITYPDSNMQTPPFVTPGAAFIKTWRVQNTGSCTWTPDYQLVYAYGNVADAQMSGLPLPIPGNVAPGQNIDLSVNLIAPLTPLTYQGFWQIKNAAGGRFGQTIWVGITTTTVQATPVATVPSNGNTCVVTFTSPQNFITVGSAFNAGWTVKNTSGEVWSSDSVDYRFISGTAMHQIAVYDFTQTIKNGESVDISVAMLAPSAPGIYSALWAIVASSRTFCFLNITMTAISN
jgi:ABC-type amino acid transport substrate-binding protein